MCSLFIFFYGSEVSKIRMCLTVFLLFHEAKSMPLSIPRGVKDTEVFQRNQVQTWGYREAVLWFLTKHPIKTIFLSLIDFWNFDWKQWLESLMYIGLSYLLGSWNGKERFPSAWTTRFFSSFPSQVWRPHKRFEKIKETTRR